ncbi:MAG: hypothetical protein Q9221_002066 [Calogaya cf. arnoldii]
MAPEPTMKRENRANDKDFFYETSAIYAFPTHLTAFATKNGGLEYDCTPWLRPTYRGRKCRRLVDEHAAPFQSDVDIEPALLPFGSTMSCNVYTVFPHLAKIGDSESCKTFKKWHDKVVVRACEDSIGNLHNESPLPHELAIDNSKVEICELGRPEAPLTPITFRVPSHYLSELWDTIIKKTSQKGFEEFKDVFLLVVLNEKLPTSGRLVMGQTAGATRKQSVSMAMEMWDQNVDTHGRDGGLVNMNASITTLVRDAETYLLTLANLSSAQLNTLSTFSWTRLYNAYHILNMPHAQDRQSFDQIWDKKDWTSFSGNNISFTPTEWMILSQGAEAVSGCDAGSGACNEIEGGGEGEDLAGLLKASRYLPTYPAANSSGA